MNRFQTCITITPKRPLCLRGDKNNRYAQHVHIINFLKRRKAPNSWDIPSPSPTSQWTWNVHDLLLTSGGRHWPKLVTWSNLYLMTHWEGYLVLTTEARTVCSGRFDKGWAQTWTYLSSDSDTGTDLDLDFGSGLVSGLDLGSDTLLPLIKFL